MLNLFQHLTFCDKICKNILHVIKLNDILLREG